MLVVVSVLDLPDGERGVLPNHHLEKAISAGVISAADDAVPQRNIQPASLDLRLGEVAHRIRCSFLPGPHKVEQRLPDLLIDTLDLTGEGAVLEVGLPYLIPLMERLHLPQEVRARANPKSSTGRADVFTRVITDHSARFDDIRAGYSGRLFLEVVPLSFPIRVQQGLTLNQLRLSVGNTSLSDADIRREHAEGPLLRVGGKAVKPRDLELSSGLFLSLNLRGPKTKGVGWQARGSAPLLDLRTPRSSDPSLFWDRVRHEGGDRIVLQPRSFYLLMSYEAVTIPPHLAAEMAAYDPTSGELRTHYAGFFDPDFGYDPDPAMAGSTAALEVRAHDVAFMIEHRQHVCKLTFERMLEQPTMLYGESGFGSNYQGQTETLGKHFVLDKGQSPTGASAGTPDEPEQLELPDYQGESNQGSRRS
jgi:dCTP deaminase